jgi:hypothetical protein
MRKVSLKGTVSRTGRTEKKIDWAEADKMLIAGCTGVQCAAYFDMHPETFYRKVEKEFQLSFTEYATKKKEKGNSMLHATQFKLALEKDRSMLIWLGKQRLGQRDNPSHDEKFDAKLALLLDKLNTLEVPKKEEE